LTLLEVGGVPLATPKMSRRASLTEWRNGSTAIRKIYMPNTSGSNTNTLTPTSLLTGTNDVFELVVAWSKGASRPVTIVFIKVNDHVLVKTTLDTDSPFTVKLPRELYGTSVKLAWAIAPEMDIDMIAIGLHKRGSNGVKKIDSKDDGVKRGAVWYVDDKTFTIE
jgi:hypothetical protein